MTLTVTGFFVLLIIAAICGAVGKALGGGSRGGLLASLALGFIGALLGPWLAQQLHLAEPLVLRVGGESSSWKAPTSPLLPPGIRWNQPQSWQTVGNISLAAQ